MAKKPKRFSSGFTLMEVMVSVTIFAGVITLVLSLFNYTLRIYRKVEAQRQVSQSVRTTMEFLVKEIRNGQVDYGIVDGLSVDVPVDSAHCPLPADRSQSTYSTADHTHIGVINVDGERECIYWVHDPDPTKQNDPTNNNLYIKKLSVATASQINPPNVKLKDLRFYVSPLHDPYSDSPSLAEQEPLVTILAYVSVTLPTGEVRTVPYQTTVSTYAYDIPSQ
jgi:prepilin-type N-terminal cleavage/methylation domain-containing protein